MKVVFLFMSKGSDLEYLVDNGSWKKFRASDHYQKIYGDECYFKMFKNLIDKGIISDLKVFFESGVNPGKAQFVKGAENYVIPNINMIHEFIDEDTIIFVRGGFKHWHDHLTRYKNTNWLICYGANTGRDKWTWWDIIFDDLNMQNIIDRHGRYQFPFIKPTNEDIFHMKASSLKYDICIGASNIHDKKGQYKSVELMEIFYKKFGYYLKAVMPGALRHSIHTNAMVKKEIFSNEIDQPGMLSKPDLSDLFASCKIFLHLGSGGQNDRSILEASACGLPVILSNSSRFTPLLKDDGFSTFVFDPRESMEQWADHLYLILDNYTSKYKWFIHETYITRMSYSEIVIPMLSAFFNILNGTKPSLEIKQKLVSYFSTIKKMEELCEKN